MLFITTIARFILISSTDGKSPSLTIKGLLGLLVPFVAYYFGLDQGVVTGAVSDFLTIISLGVTAFGLARKIYYTFTGQNKVL